VPLTAIVLAAGFSRRFGSAKQLFAVDGELLIRRAAKSARAVAPTIVVIPTSAPEIRDAIRDLDVTILENEQAAEGMASSIRAGVRACNGDVLLTVCDQPGVTGAHLQLLIDSGSPLAASGYGGIAGVPAFFDARYRHELLALRGDSGARAVIAAHRHELVVLPLYDARDVDTRPLNLA
jgi:CTP:molybdopterin cytidylyltransferase MocA